MSLGSVDLLGLDKFGGNPGLNPIYGALIGGGVAGVTAISLRHLTTGTPAKYADLFGFGAGFLAAAGLYAMPGTRHAAFGALAGAFLGAGLSFLEKVLFGGLGETNGVGYPMIQSLGIPQIQALNGSLGVAQIGPIPPAYGTIPGVVNAQPSMHQLSGIAGAQLSASGGPPVSLMGEQSAGAQQATLMSGVQTSGIANAYGANLFGGRS